jgi:chromosome partitioning protein
MNQKGGVGKTTTAVNVSAALAAKGATVCLIDLDPQAHSTAHFGIDTQSEDGKSIYDVLHGKMKLRDVRLQIADNLWLIPAHLDMVGAELELASAVGRDVILRGELAEDNLSFDYLMIDCPPSLGLFTLNALTSVHEILVPLQPQYFSLHGFRQLLITLEAVTARLNRELRLTGVLLTMFDNTTMSAEVTDDINLFFQHRDKLPRVCEKTKIFETKIRRNIRLAEASSHGTSIFEYDSRSNGAEDYRHLAEEIVNQVQ